MTSNDNHDDLTELFTAQDETFASDEFAASVMAPIRRRARYRQAILFGAGGLGLGAAVSQLVSLIGSWQPARIETQSTLALVQDRIAALSSSIEPIWLITAGMVAVCVAMMAAMERA